MDYLVQGNEIYKNHVGSHFFVQRSHLYHILKTIQKLFSGSKVGQQNYLPLTALRNPK